MMFIAIAIILTFIAWQVKYRHVTWLITGYNTASKEEKEKYDLEKLSRYFGNFLFLLASSYLLWGIALLLFPVYEEFLYWAGFISSFVVIVLGIIYMNAGNKLKK